MRQLIYTMFISDNRKSFHLWWKENLVKHQKVSKYYKNDCRLKWLNFGPNLPKKGYKWNSKSKHQHWILRTWTSLGTKFQPKLTICYFFGPILHKKGYFWSKTKKVTWTSLGTKFQLKLIIFHFFGPILHKKEYFRSETEIVNIITRFYIF